MGKTSATRSGPSEKVSGTRRKRSGKSGRRSRERGRGQGNEAGAGGAPRRREGPSPGTVVAHRPEGRQCAEAPLEDRPFAEEAALRSGGDAKSAGRGALAAGGRDLRASC